MLIPHTALRDLAPLRDLFAQAEALIIVTSDNDIAELWGNRELCFQEVDDHGEWNWGGSIQRFLKLFD